MWDAQGNLIDTKTYTGTPTAAQQALRVTEINYHPTDPTASETTQMPGVTAEDFEFIELLNISGSTLVLDGAQFIDGITYTFPASTSLMAGERMVLVKNIAAFEMRYGTGLNIAGPYQGLLDNGGERLKLVDAVGEEILDFDWNDNWYPPSDGDGRSMVLRDTAILFNEYDEPSSWGISASVNGSPVAPDTSYLVHFEGWRYSEFNGTERDDPLTGMLTSDMDNDGLSNWAEYCFGTNPRVADKVDNELMTAENGGTTYYSLEFTRRANAFDILWMMRRSDDLASWQNETSNQQGSPQALPNGLERVNLRSSTPVSQGGKRFFTIRATAVQP